MEAVLAHAEPQGVHFQYSAQEPEPGTTHSLSGPSPAAVRERPQRTSPSPVRHEAAAILTGFVAGFSGGDDHYLGKLDIFLQTALKGGNLVGVTARFGLRDWSGNWDDKYDGPVDFAVPAEQAGRGSVI